MEGKKLNFNAPLLSVRVKRKVIETPSTRKQPYVPSHKAVSELTEVTKPAAVPFVWERTPGRPKDERKTDSSPQEEPSTTPRFPPGRAYDISKRVSGELLEHQNVARPQMEASPLNENTRVIDMNEGSASEEEDNAVLDALDTLSRADSFSWNCSISGLSDNDGPFSQPSTTFRADPQTQDLMMTRFLPAARAMIIETPRYVQKKKSVEREFPRDVRKVVSGELRPLLERYGSNTASHHSRYQRNASSEVENDEYNDRDRKSGVSCGLFRQLSLKNALRLFDPMPRIKSRPQSPISSAPEVRRMARTAHSGPLPQIHHEKHDLNETYWNDIKIGVKQQEFIQNKLTGVPNQVRHSVDSYRKEGLSPHRSSRSGCISPYRNDKPQSPFHDGARFLGVPKIVKNTEAGKFTSISKESGTFLDFSGYQMYKRESDLLSRLAENTLYIDLLNDTEVPIFDMVSSEAEMLNKFSRKNLRESRGTEETIKPKSFNRVERIVKSSAIGSTAAGFESSRCISNIEAEADNIKILKHDQDLDHETRSLQCSTVHPAENLATRKENLKEVNVEEDISVGFPQSPQPPPLPKSPSEPWLWRTLSSISLRNPFSQGQPKKKSRKNFKWENIVRTSIVSHDHKRYSEELISHVSKQ